MIEGVATVTTAHQENPQAAQAQAEVPVEKTADIVQGKVNPVDEVEGSSNRAGSEEETEAQNPSASGTKEGRIIDLLG